MYAHPDSTGAMGHTVAEKAPVGLIPTLVSAEAMGLASTAGQPTKPNGQKLGATNSHFFQWFQGFWFA